MVVPGCASRDPHMHLQLQHIWIVPSEVRLRNGRIDEGGMEVQPHPSTRPMRVFRKNQSFVPTLPDIVPSTRRGITQIYLLAQLRRSS